MINKKAVQLIGGLVISFLLGVATAFIYEEEPTEEVGVVEQTVVQEVVKAPVVEESVSENDPAFDMAITRARSFEGFSHTPYILYGKWHIGYGHSISSPEYYPYITRDEAELLLVKDMRIVETELLRNLPFYQNLPQAARAVLLDMGYNMGVPKLLKFTYALYAMQEGAWEMAAHEIIDSLYFEQVRRRATSNLNMILDLTKDREARVSL